MRGYTGRHINSEIKSFEESVHDGSKEIEIAGRK